ncbi:hypothetical protein MLD38_002649 [Melastoma candidum]|uniref:Uncharacterized protein n=1 Tax=Melastoma candidum TaxID=119954 RepID=A0ACB9S335_9MYRT|nr:hypothetical protein MLD38_002649 [Melastoma candidum]
MFEGRLMAGYLYAYETGRKKDWGRERNLSESGERQGIKSGEGKEGEEDIKAASVVTKGKMPLIFENWELQARDQKAEAKGTI